MLEGRRGGAVPRAADRDSGQRGCRQCRSACPAAGRGGDASLRVRGLAGVPVAAGPGRDLSGLRPKSNAATVAIGEARARRGRGPAAARAGPPARQPLSRREAAGAGPGLSICPR